MLTLTNCEEQKFFDQASQKTSQFEATSLQNNFRKDRGFSKFLMKKNKSVESFQFCINPIFLASL